MDESNKNKLFLILFPQFFTLVYIRLGQIINRCFISLPRRLSGKESACQ